MPIPPEYAEILTASSNLKLRALSLRCEGGDLRLEQSRILLHRAYRLEKRALDLLDDPSVDTCVRSLLEQCGCLLDAEDGSGAMLVRAELYMIFATLTSREVDAYLGKIKPQLDATCRLFWRTVPSEHFARLLFTSTSLVPESLLDRRVRQKLCRQLAGYRKRFPGDLRASRLYGLLAEPFDPQGAKLARKRACDLGDDHRPLRDIEAELYGAQNAAT